MLDVFIICQNKQFAMLSQNGTIESKPVGNNFRWDRQDSMSFKYQHQSCILQINIIDL